MKGRTVGYAAAGALAALAAVLIAWSIWHAAQSTRASAGPAPQIGPPPDTSSVAPAERPSSVRDIVQNADKGHVVGYDRREPTRLAYELTWSTLEPQQSGEVLVTTPQAVLYPDERWLVHVRSEVMSFRSAEGGAQPESGRFEGNTLIRLFDQPMRQRIEARALERALGVWQVVDEFEPVASLRTEELAFDGSTGEVSAPSDVSINAPGLAVSLGPTRVVVDEARRVVSYFRADNGGRAVRTAVQSRSTGAGSTTASAGASKGSATPADRTDHYHATFEGDIRIEGDGRTVSAEALELWATLLDGSLPDDAITDVLSRARKRPDARAGSASASSANAADDDEVTLAWSGPLTLRPLADRPAQLTSDSLAVRFSAPNSGVELRDASSGGDALCAELAYGFTSGRLAVAGAAQRLATLQLPGVGRASAERFELDLRTGAGSILGASSIAAFDRGSGSVALDPFRRRDASWTDRADFTLATRDGAVDFDDPQPLREATLQGGVVAHDADRTLAGDTLRLLDADPSSPVLFNRVIVEGSAGLDAGAEGAVRARRLDALFTPAEGPGAGADMIVTAAGDMVAERAGDSLRASLAEARLTLDPAGEATLRSFYAEGDIRISGPDGLIITGDTARVTPGLASASVFELTGAPAVASRPDGAIEAPSMRYDEALATLTTFSGGELRFTPPQSDSAPYESVRVTWTGAMSFDDTRGRAELSGDVVATAEAPLVRDAVQGDRLVLAFTPGAAAGSGEPKQQTRLLSAVISGGESGRARAEARRMAPGAGDGAPARLERLAFADGPSISVEVESAAVKIPGPGRLLLEDRREPDAGDERDDLRGSTLFEWTGLFSASRDAKVADMHTGVRVLHRPRAATEAIELLCENLTCDLFPSDPADPRSSLEPAEIEASGQVLATRGQTWLRAETLRFDTSKQIADATGSPVSFFDEGFLKPETGSLLRWDIGRDRFQWRDAGSVTIPR